MIYNSSSVLNAIVHKSKTQSFYEDLGNSRYINWSLSSFNVHQTKRTPMLCKHISTASSYIIIHGGVVTLTNHRNPGCNKCIVSVLWMYIISPGHSMYKVISSRTKNEKHVWSMNKCHFKNLEISFKYQAITNKYCD